MRATIDRGERMHEDFRALFDGHAPRVVRLAALLGADDPEDVAQEAFCRLYEKRDDVQGTLAHAGPYLNRIVSAYQYTFEFGSAATADRVLQTVLTWPEGCGKRIGDAVTSSAPEIHGRSDGREGYWYTMSFKQPDGIQRTELVLVARAADRISLIVLHERGGAQAIDGVDASTLINLQLERLG